jgi:hypothetical protein
MKAYTKMNDIARKSHLVKLQRTLIYIIIALFTVCIILGFIDKQMAATTSYIAVILLFLAAPIRMIWVGEYFRTTGQKKYQALAYIVIAIIILTVLFRLLLQNV